MANNKTDIIKYNRSGNTISVRPDCTNVFFVINVYEIQSYHLTLVEESNEYALVIDLKGARIIVKNVRPNEDDILDHFIKGCYIMM